MAAFLCAGRFDGYFHFALKYLYIEHFIVLQNISYDFVKEI